MTAEGLALSEAQRVALAAVIRTPDIAGDLFSRVRIEDLDGVCLHMAEAIHGLRLSRKPIDSLSVIDEMERRGTLRRWGGPAAVHEVAGYLGDWQYAADIIARASRLRRLDVLATRLHQRITTEPDVDPAVLAKGTLDAAQGVLDTIEADGDIDTPALGEFLATSNVDEDWVIPGLLERGDRFILTGSEGLGKSVLHRQIAVCAASGVHPFTGRPIPPARVLYIDCENGAVKDRRALRPLAIAAARMGSDPAERMFIETIPAGLDLLRDDDALWLLRRVSALQPDLLVIGPVYRLHQQNPNDEETARQVTVVLDRCRSAANCAMALEAHAGHGPGDGKRPVRPTGSSLWLRWPEFGYGLRKEQDGPQGQRVVSLEAWRGDRETRNWPTMLRAGGVLPWTAGGGWEPGPTQQAWDGDRGLYSVGT